MSQRERNMLWLSDILGHLRRCHKQLTWAQDAETIHILTETMLRDLENCRRLCEAVQRRREVGSAV